MDPRTVFCNNPDCSARGQIGKGNIRIHSQKSRCYISRLGGDTFTETKGTVFCRLCGDDDLVTVVLTMLACGCLPQGIVAAFKTAYIERLKATFRARLVSLVRKGQALARQTDTLQHGLHLVGSAYNFCTYHKSLRVKSNSGNSEMDATHAGDGGGHH